MRSSLTPMLLASLGQAAAMMLSAQLGLASPQGQARAEAEGEQIQVAPTRTGKERLGGKASDEQRVDNCKVPLELRGPSPRPDDCAATQPTENGASQTPAEPPQPAPRAQSR